MLFFYALFYFFNTCNGIHRADAYVPYFVISLIVNIIKFSKIFHRAPDSVMKPFVAHKRPQALHPALCIRFNFDRDNRLQISRYVVDLCL